MGAWTGEGLPDGGGGLEVTIRAWCGWLEAGAGHCWRRRREDGMKIALSLGGSDSLYSLVYVDLFMKNWAQFTGDWMLSLEGEIGDIT